MLNYDVVGCGEVLFQYHAPVLNQLREIGALHVRACIDASRERARHAARLLGASAHGTSPAEVGIDGADAVFIATPPDYHASIAEEYVARGKHALIEKPFVCTAAEGERLLTTARATGSRVLVGHMRRLYPSLRIAREFLLAGGVGVIERVEACEGSRWEWPASSSYVIQSPFGGVLYDTGSHVLDSLLFVLGLDEPSADARAEVITTRRDRPEEPAHDFRAEFVLESAALGSVAVDFRVSRTDALARAIKVHGATGTLVLSGGFAMHPILIVGGRSFRLDAFVEGPHPTDVMGCFLLEHQALQAAASNHATPSVLDAGRFILLTRLLERMAQR